MEINNTVWWWWTGLCLVALFNLCLLFLSYKKLKKKLPLLSDFIVSIRKKQFSLSAIYMLGCGFRSILPRGDIRRIVLYDSWISSVVIGRTVATIAELSFVAQWSLILYEAGKHTQHKTILFLAKLPLPIIVVAECFSWYACTTTNYIGTAIEESLWAVAAILMAYGLFLARSFYKGKVKQFLTLGLVFAFGYIAYMIFVDVPAYVFNWLDAEASGKSYVGLIEGFKEVATQWHFTGLYSDWEYEMIWMSLYFSIAVWISLSIPHMPSFDQDLNVSKK